MPSGYIEIDFGAAPGNSQASVNVTGQGAINTSSFVESWKSGEATTDHTAMESSITNMEILCSNIVNGVGFTITATSRIGRLTGKYKLYWAWISSSTNIGTVEIDFGDAPGISELEYNITGQSSILSDSMIEVWKDGNASTNHTITDVQISDFNLYASAPIVGTGFKIYAVSNMGRLTGKYRINWLWN